MDKEKRREKLLGEILPPKAKEPVFKGFDFQYGSVNGDEILRDLGDMAAAASKRGHTMTCETLTAAIVWIHKLTGCGRA